MKDNSYFKVDIHAHIMPKHMPDFKKEFGYGGFIVLDHYKDDYARMMLDTGKFFRDIYKNTWDPVTRIEEMDETGVDVQVLSTIPVLFSYWAEPKDTLRVSQFLNDHIAGIMDEYPTRFTGLATLPMNDIDLAIDELDRAITELGFEGVEIGSHIPTKDEVIYMHDERLQPFFKRAEELDAAVFCHPWDMPWRLEPFWAGWLAGMPAETAKTIGDLIFSGVFTDYPDLRFAFAHCGGSFAGTIGRFEHGFNVRPDLFTKREMNPRNFLDHFWVDTLTADPDVLRYNMSVFDKNKFALGSDYPFPLGEHHPGKMVEEMDDLRDDLKESVLGLAALRWLGISKDRFLKS